MEETKQKAAKPATTPQPEAAVEQFEVATTNDTNIIELPEELMDVEILSVSYVAADPEKNRPEPFISIVARNDKQRVAVACSTTQYEAMGFSAKLPLNSCGERAVLNVVTIPASTTNVYGFRNRAGVLEAFKHNGRIQLRNIDAVYKGAIQTIAETCFKASTGRAYDPHAATADDQALYNSFLLAGASAR